MPAGVLDRQDLMQSVVGGQDTGSGFWAATNADGTVQLDADWRYLRWLQSPAGTGFYQYTLPTGLTSAFHRMRWHFVLDTALSANSAIIWLTSTATVRAQIFMTTGRTIQLRNNTTPVGSASSALVVGREYLFEMAANPGALTQELNIYEPDGSLFYGSGAQAMAAGTMNQWRFGNITSATVQYRIRALAYGDQAGELGPVPRLRHGLAPY